MADDGQSCEKMLTGDGVVVIRRLHRMVRQGYRPWLGYDVTNGADYDIHLQRRDNTATLASNGTVTFTSPLRIPPPPTGRSRPSTDSLTTLPGEDEALFDAVFPPGIPNRCNLVRRLYEVGVGAW